VRRAGADVVVRINRPLSLAVRDLEHSICPDVDAIACTKVDSASHIRLLDELVTELEEKARHAGRAHQIHRDGGNRRRVLPHS
jgi:citrate lyase subunit beta/citryl-CoA lyase